MPYINIPLTQSEIEFIKTLESNYDSMCEINQNLVELLIKSIGSSNAEFQKIQEKIVRQQKAMEQFSKYRSESLSEILIKRRTI